MATIKYEDLDIESVDVKEEVDSLENRHHDDVGETRLENIQGQDPLEPALSLEYMIMINIYKIIHGYGHFEYK